MGLRILITNNTLATRAGTELYVRDVAFGLLARGHRPAAYSTVLGVVARELRAGNVPVVDDLDDLGDAPQLIHGHHHLETTTASLRFPDAPVVSFCHGWAPWEELPTRLPTVARHVAVDEPCRERLVGACGIPAAGVRLLPNFVDLRRFAPRGPLPPRPRRALAFGNNAGEGTFLPAIRSACERRGIALDAAGLGTAVLEQPEKALGGYDLVFAKARAAMEAMATGCAVVLCDLGGVGPLVTAGEFGRLLALNFGVRTLSLPLDEERIGAEIDRYDPGEARRVRDLMREAGDLERRLDELIALYEEVLREPRAASDPAALATAAARYLRTLTPRIKGNERLRAELREARAASQRRAPDRPADAGALARRVARLEAQLAQARREPGLRLQLAAVRLPLLGPLLRRVGRRVFGPAPPLPD